jgi:8-oxo-dGTP pyrophosphatase MutT (NUDIX family)
MSLPFPITYPSDGPLDQLHASPLIKRWAMTLSPRFNVTNVDVVSFDSFGRRIGYVQLDVFYSVNGISHQERIILTGKSVMVAVVLKAQETSELYSVLVHQPRIGCGKLTFEFPAGMTDDVQDYRAVAARELHEEIGLECQPSELIPLSELFRPEAPFNYIATSHYDEGTYFFLVKKEMPITDIQQLEGKHCGADQDEQITLHVVKFEDVWRLSDEPATLAAQLMARDLFRRGTGNG